MRKVYLCLVMTFQVITTAMAQVPLSEYATEWKTIFGYEGKDLKDHYENTLEVRVVGDSLINDISYRKLNYFGMIRYAEEGLKCYFRPKRFNSDFLLYDITANVGDTCFLYTGINDDPSCKYSGDGNGDIWVLKEYGLDTIAPWVVTAKTIIDNRTHLKIVLTIDNYAVVERLIVEGVGSECFPMNFQGEAIYDVVNNTIPDMLNPELTASWEKGLEMVANKEIDSKVFMQKLEQYVRSKITKVKNR